MTSEYKKVLISFELFQNKCGANFWNLANNFQGGFFLLFLTRYRVEIPSSETRRAAVALYAKVMTSTALSATGENSPRCEKMHGISTVPAPASPRAPAPQPPPP